MSGYISARNALGPSTPRGVREGQSLYARNANVRQAVYRRTASTPGGGVVISWDDNSELRPLLERCRELWYEWTKLKEREVQLSLLDESSDSSPSLKKS